MNKKLTLNLLFIVLVSLPAILPLLHPGFFTTDDGEWMIIRLSAFYMAFADGQFPVRFLDRLNFGYGYPVAEFLYPGSMYFGSVLHALKIGFVDSIKIVMAISLIGSGIFTNLWLSKIFNKTASIIGALVYLYLPYHLYDVYTRGSVGEVFALLWVPFILWQIERKNLFFTSLGITLLILSHNTLALLFLPLLIAVMGLNIAIAKEKKSLMYNYIGAWILVIGLSAFFWLPVLFEIHLTMFSSTNVAHWGEYFASLQLLGYASLFILLLTAINIFTKKLQISKHRLTLIFFIFAIVSLFLSSSLSFFLWKFLPEGLIQFPFRFLSVSLIAIAFLAAANVSVLKNWYKKIVIILIAIFLLMSVLDHTTGIKFFDKGEGYYITNDATTTVKDEYMPVWVKEKPLKRPEKKVEVIKGQATINGVSLDNKSISFTADVKREATIQLNTIFWPGWKTFIDGKEVAISYQNSKGLISFVVPEGTHQISASFFETPIRLVGDIISLCSLIVLIFFNFKLKRT